MTMQMFTPIALMDSDGLKSSTNQALGHFIVQPQMQIQLTFQILRFGRLPMLSVSEVIL